MSLVRWLAIAALVLLPTMALGQSKNPVPAPAFHPGTKVTFPARIADAELTRSIDYGKTYNEPGLGQSWHYVVPQSLSAAVYIYTLGQNAIATGAGNPALLQQFEEAMSDILESKKYEQLAVIKGPANCTVGSITFRCVTESCVVVSTRSADKLQLLMTGFRNHFLKIRLDWHQNSPQGDAVTDRFVQALVATVLR